MSAVALAWRPPAPGALADERDPWWDRAACLGADGDLFFPRPEAPLREARAKAYCARCPVTGACLRDALRTGDTHAIRGGLNASERLEAYPPERRCRLGRHLLSPENTGNNGRCLPCRRDLEAREREEERFERTGSTAPQYGRRAESLTSLVA
jgi:WhiB family redox-sensing transcriptional regulator